MKKNDSFLGCEIPSPVGPLTLLATDKGLAGIHFQGRYEGEWSLGSSPILQQTERELGEYFAGERTEFEVELDVIGSDFQLSVWRELSRIPFGSLASYLDIAKAIDNPKAVRAVGLANGRNPVSIIVPCHRVIGSSGKLVGYGGGLERKRTLLVHEKAGLLF